MSTKVTESCPRCGTDTMPTDKAVACDSPYGTFPVKMWRYECASCEWTWTNLKQREHNAQAYSTSRRKAKMQNMGFL